MKFLFCRIFNSTILIISLFAVAIHNTLSFQSGACNSATTKIIMLKTCLSFSVQTITKQRSGQQVFLQEFPFRALLNGKSPRRKTNSRNRRNYNTKSQRLPLLSDHHSSSSSSSYASTTTTTMPKRKKNKFYAVAVGRNTGIYSTWDECQSQVKGYSNARFKSFSTVEEAQSFINASASNNNAAKTSAASQMEPFSQMAASVQTKRPRVMVSNTVVAKESASIVGSAINPIKIEVPAAMAAAAERPRRGKSGAAPSTALRNAAGAPNSNTPTNQNGGGDDDGNHGQGSAFGQRHPHKLWFHVMFDGGSRGNPHGHAGSGTYILTQKFYAMEAPKRSSKSKPKTEVTRITTNIRTYLGSGVLTNNQAEYTGLVTGLKAVVAALEEAIHTKSPLQDLVILIQGDSDLIVKQMNGVYACKSPKLKDYYSQAKDLVSRIRHLSQRMGATCELVFEHVYREDNTIADGLANQAMDAQRSWTTSKGGDDDGAIEV